MLRCRGDGIDSVRAIIRSTLASTSHKSSCNSYTADLCMGYSIQSRWHNLMWWN